MVKIKNKKIITAVLAAILSFSAVSCGSDESSEEKISSSSSETSSESETEKEKDETNETAVSETEETTEENAAVEDDENPLAVLGETADINDYLTEETPNPPLWKATDPDTGNVLYLMGTIHVAGENTFPLPDYIMDIYNDCDGIAVEYNVNALNSNYSLLQEFTIGMMYSDGTTIQDHLSEETYEKAKAYFESIDSYSEFFDGFTAGYWVNLMENVMILKLENLSTTGVDSAFITYAEDDGKEVVNIEELSAQINAITAYSDELADYLLSQYIDEADNIEEYAESLGELYNFWAVGDVDSMVEIDEEEMEELPDDLKDDYEEYMQVLLTNRNKQMAEKAAEFLKNGDNYLFMVGSMHYSDTTGVDDLLAEMGFTVEKIA